MAGLARRHGVAPGDAYPILAWRADIAGTRGPSCRSSRFDELFGGRCRQA
ncbi:MAG: hypothetical protein BJ554DRAFT_1485 [Olpidium bornovanus]|uniref:Uncharacterized protein n=1 Tax=Olpidium bornovanus TaxID=278681 RepID=A0A8H8DMC6_9FUNG|nr:MAG: hypothetical protein BJ554DRAFT_1485 [Olpidium bornovanus]